MCLYTVDTVYELAQKRTYLVMLIQVGIYSPLLVAVLYPWLTGKYKIRYYQQNDDDEEEKDEELITDLKYDKEYPLYKGCWSNSALNFQHDSKFSGQSVKISSLKTLKFL